METAFSQLTVCFEAPFWVCLYERIEQGRYTVCKITFGAEPREQEVLDFLLLHWHGLRFSPAIPADAAPARPGNPKRLQRQIAQQLNGPGIGTKAQQALQLQQEQGRQARQSRARAGREAEAQRRFALRAAKRREKHRGH